jgi:hypothetical protein
VVFQRRKDAQDLAVAERLQFELLEPFESEVAPYLAPLVGPSRGDDG